MNEHLTRLRLNNVTAFSDAALGTNNEFHFVAGINAIIGENGAGKSHVLKAIFLATEGSDSKKSTIYDAARVFGARIRAEIIRYSQPNQDYAVILHDTPSSKKNEFKISKMSEQNSGKSPLAGSVVLIPSVDMVGHSNRFLSTWEEYDLDFDATYRDIVQKLLLPEKRAPAKDVTNIINDLEGVLRYRVAIQEERIVFQSEVDTIPAPLFGEGLRKIATLILLAKNGKLRPGTVLLWDEPETNLNPKLMDELVSALLSLGRNGVQIILATHSYIILRELDVQRKSSDQIRYFSLEPTPAGTTIHQFDELSQVRPNSILDQYASLYDRNLEKLLGVNDRG